MVIFQTDYNFIRINLTDNFFTYVGFATFACTCGRLYKNKDTMIRHQRYECGKEPQFPCPHCPYRGKRKEHLQAHMINKHMTL